MSEHPRSRAPNIFPEIVYDDCPAALEWLAQAFGFVKGEVIVGSNGSIAHARAPREAARCPRRSRRAAEMHLGPGTIMPKSPMAEFRMRSPRALQGIRQALYVAFADPDGHCERARAAGAEIVMAPSNTDYGARNYITRDWRTISGASAPTGRAPQRARASPSHHGLADPPNGGQLASSGHPAGPLVPRPPDLRPAAGKAIEEVYDARATNRIRSYYLGLAGAEARYFLLTGHDDAVGVFENMGLSASRAQLVFTSASMIAIVDRVVAGAGVALLIGAAVGAAPGVAVGAGAAAAVALAIAHLIHERRSVTRAFASMEVLFPSSAGD